MGLGSWLKRQGSGILYGASGGLDALGDIYNDITGKTASRDAARAQVNAAREANALQERMFNKSIELQEPWRQAGVGALSDLQGGLSRGEFEAGNDQFAEGELPGFRYGEPQYQEDRFKFDFTEDPGFKFRQEQGNKAIERSAAARGGLFAGATMRDLAGFNSGLASQEYGDAFNRARGSFESDRAFGRNKFSQDRDFSYGAARDQYSDANANRNFRYGVFSDTQNRKRQDLSNRFSRLSALAGIGQDATNSQVGAGSRFGDAASSNIMDIGNAQAAGRVGGYNAQRDFWGNVLSIGAKLYGAK